MSDVARQLSLFKGKRQRGVRAPPAREFATHCALADVIRRWIMPGWKFTHLPFGELRAPGTAARLKRMGVTPGWPDLVFIGPARSVFWLELKRRRVGRLSDEQARVAEHLIVCGFDYLCTDAIEEAITALVERGILRAMRVQ